MTTLPPQPAPEVILEGDGIASVCVARLLTDAGVGCRLHANPRPKLAAILLGEQTIHLLESIFSPAERQTELFVGFPRIRRRIVLWGEVAGPVDLPHCGIVAVEAELLRRLWLRVPPLDCSASQPFPPKTWWLHSSRTASATGEERSFGTRLARIARAELRDTAEEETCWVESVASGWLFLVTLGARCASLIAAGAEVQQLLAESRLIAPRVDSVLSESAPVSVFPRLLHHLAGDRSFACGSAAMSFDPLCGEGAGHAVREAFLGAACLREAIAGGAAQGRIAEHYTTRLKQGFLRHLQTCLPFYATGGSSEFWTGESEALRLGIGALQAELLNPLPPSFRLVDRDLVAL